MLALLFLNLTLWCYHSLESSRRDDFNQGHIIGFGWEMRKLWKPLCSLFLNCNPGAFSWTYTERVLIMLVAITTNNMVVQSNLLCAATHWRRLKRLEHRWHLNALQKYRRKLPFLSALRCHQSNSIRILITYVLSGRYTQVWPYRIIYLFYSMMMWYCDICNCIRYTTSSAKRCLIAKQTVSS